MLGATHRLTGGFMGVTYAASQGMPWPIAATYGLVASSTAHGFWSPDIDQTKLWITVRKALPGFADQTMNHRSGISHWWLLPIVAWAFIMPLHGDERTLAIYLLIGWVSHLVGDFIFGQLYLFPGSKARFGVGFKTGGVVEKWTAAVLSVAIPLVLTEIAGVTHVWASIR